MAYELIREAELGVDNVVLADQYEIVEAAAGAEAELVDHLEVAHKTKGPGRRDLLAEGLAFRHLEFAELVTHRSWITELIRDREVIRRLDDQRLVAFADLVASVNDQLLDRGVLFDKPHLFESFEETQGRSIEHRDLAVHLDQQIGDTTRMQC